MTPDRPTRPSESKPLNWTCSCCNAPSKRALCNECEYAGCTDLEARPTASDPHLNQFTGLTPSQRRSRRPWHQERIEATRKRTLMLMQEGERTLDDVQHLAQQHVDHHQACLDQLAYHRSNQ